MENVTAIDFTKPMDAGVLVRDYRPTLIMKKSTTLDGLQRISDIQMFPHSQTHIDLPNRLDSPHPPFEDSTSFNLKDYSPCTYPCTIISLHQYANSMRDACAKQVQWLGGKPQSPYNFWENERLFRDLLSKLKITSDDLRKLDIPKGHFVLFYTGWNEFAPSDCDLTHPYWYPWHPYLMSPYLNEGAVQYLVDEVNGLDCSGIGVDIGSMESPLRNIVERDARPPITVAPEIDWDIVIKEARVSENREQQKKDQFYVVHTQVLKRKKILLENVHIPAFTVAKRKSRNENGQYNPSHPFPVCRGEGVLALTPFFCTHPLSDFLLTAVTFVQKENVR